MNLHWDRFDNALSDLLKFFAAPLLNFIFVSTIFAPILLGMATKLWGAVPALLLSMSARYPTAGADGAEPNAMAVTLEWWDSLKDVATGYAIILIIVFAVTVFAIDVVTRFLGAWIPFAYQVDEEALVRRPELDNAFSRLQPMGRGEFSRWRRWMHARHWLDQSAELPGYRSTRIALETKLANIELTFLYVRGYVVLFIALVALRIYFYAEPTCKANALACESARAAFFNPVWYAIVTVAAATFVLGQYLHYFKTYLELVETDLDTFSSIRLEDPDGPETVGRRPRITECVGIRAPNGNSILSYGRKATREIGRRLKARFLKTLPQKPRSP